MRLIPCDWPAAQPEPIAIRSRSVHEIRRSILRKLEPKIRQIQEIMKESNRAPLPWKASLTFPENRSAFWQVYDPPTKQHFNGNPVANCFDSEANARFICRAVNSHDALVEALRDVLRCCVTVNGMPDKDKGCTEQQQNAMDKARVALAKAEGVQ